MGFHICEWCKQNGWLSDSVLHAFRPTSSQDVRLEFASGRTWEFPHDGLLHYVTSHGYKPPDEFIDDVMNSTVVSHQLFQTKGIRLPQKVGYLAYPDIPTGTVPKEFVERLLDLIAKADWTGTVRHARGL